MTDPCRKIMEISKLPGTSPLESLIVDVAKWREPAEALDTCDLGSLKRDLKNDFNIDDFIQTVGQGDRFNYKVAAEQLFYILKSSPPRYLLHVMDKHLGQTTQKELQWLRNETFNNALMQRDKDRYKTRVTLYENFFADPQIAELFEGSSFQEEYGLYPEHLRPHIEKGEWGELARDLDVWNGWMPKIYEWLYQRAQNRIRFWNLADWIWNKGVRTLLGLGSGIFGGPAGVIVEGFADSFGEEAVKMASWTNYYTFKEARAKIAYHAPFSLLKGLGFYFGPWVGGTIFTGTTFVERTGDPEFGPLPMNMKERLLSGAIAGGFSGLSVLGLNIAAKFAPGLLGSLVPKREPIPLPPRPPTPSPVQTHVPSPKTVETAAPLRPASPPEPRPALRIVPIPVTVNYTLVETELAKSSFAKITAPGFKELLRELVKKIEANLSRGKPLEEIGHVRPVKLTIHGHPKDIHEGSLFGERLKVYFETSTTNGSGTLKILGYADGPRQNESLLADLARPLSQRP